MTVRRLCPPFVETAAAAPAVVVLDDGIDVALATIWATDPDTPLVLRASTSLQLTRHDADLIGAALIGRLDWCWTGVPKHARRTIRNGVIRTLRAREAHQQEPDTHVAQRMVWGYRRRTGARPPAGVKHEQWVASCLAWLRGDRMDAA